MLNLKLKYRQVGVFRRTTATERQAGRGASGTRRGTDRAARAALKGLLRGSHVRLPGDVVRKHVCFDPCMRRQVRADVRSFAALGASTPGLVGLDAGAAWSRLAPSVWAASVPRLYYA